MEITLTIAYSALFIFMIGKCKFYQFDEIPNIVVKAGYIIKLLAGISLGLIYTYYYTDRSTADTFKFFDDSKVLFDSFFTRPIDFWRMLTGIDSGSEELKPYYNTMKNWYDVYSPFNDNRTMIRFNALLRFISFGHYYVHVAFISFLSLTGIVAIVKVLKSEYPFLALEFLLIFILTPSVLFWGSGLLKDALVFFSFGISLYIFHQLVTKEAGKLKWFILYLAAMFLLMISKFQIFLISIPLFAAWFVCIQFKSKKTLSFLGIMAFYILLLYGFSIVFPENSLLDLLSLKQAAFVDLAVTSNAGSLINVPKLEPTFISIIFNAPLGFLTALFRPFIFDSGPILTLVAGLENTLILLFGVWCIIKMNLNNLKGKILPWFCILYVIFSFTLIGIITPVMGAIVRYKAHALPFLIIIFVLISYKNQSSIFKSIYKKIF